MQFSQDEPHKVMITSEDSKVRIFDGVDMVCKFKGKDSVLCNSLGLGDTIEAKSCSDNLT